jgi:hypothetical protein
MVLGSLAESRLFLSVNNYGFAWLLRPVVLVIMTLTLAAIVYPLLRARWRKQKKGEGPSVAANALSSAKRTKLSFNWASAFSLSLAVIFACALWQSRTFPLSARFFPWVLGFPVFVLAVIQFIMDLTGRGDKGKDEKMKGTEMELPKEVVNRRTACVFGWIFGWFAAIWLFGFTLGAPLATFLQLKMGERERWSLSLILTGMVWAFIYFVFRDLLHLPFPRGSLFVWLGMRGL